MVQWENNEEKWTFDSLLRLLALLVSILLFVNSWNTSARQHLLCSGKQQSWNRRIQGLFPHSSRGRRQFWSLEFTLAMSLLHMDTPEHVHEYGAEGSSDTYQHLWQGATNKFRWRTRRAITPCVFWIMQLFGSHRKQILWTEITRLHFFANIKGVL